MYEVTQRCSPHPTRSGQLTDILGHRYGVVVPVEGRDSIVDVGDDERHVGRHFVAETGLVFQDFPGPDLKRVEAALGQDGLSKKNVFKSL